MAQFTMAFTTEAMLGLLNKAKDTAYPDGLAWKVRRALLAKFRPVDSIAQVEIRQLLNKVKMKNKIDDPALYSNSCTGYKTGMQEAARILMRMTCWQLYWRSLHWNISLF